MKDEKDTRPSSDGEGLRKMLVRAEKVLDLMASMRFENGDVMSAEAICSCAAELHDEVFKALTPREATPAEGEGK